MERGIIRCALLFHLFYSPLYFNFSIISGYAKGYMTLRAL